MKLPFNLGFGKFGRRGKSAGDDADDDAFLDEMAEEDRLEKRRSQTVILDDPDAEDEEAERQSSPARAQADADAAAGADGKATESPEAGFDNLLAMLSDEELARDDEETPTRRLAGPLVAVAAGIGGLVAIGFCGWWLAGLLHSDESDTARSDVPRVAVDIPQLPPPGGGLNRLAAQGGVAAGSMSAPAETPRSDIGHATSPAVGTTAQHPSPETAERPPVGGGTANAHGSMSLDSGATHPATSGEDRPSSAAGSAAAPALRSLNALSALEDEPGAGIVVASITPQAFANLPMPKAMGPLSPVPDAALIENGPAGRLPKVDSKGRRPGQVYARPFEPRDDQAKWPRVAVVISGLGLSRAATEAAIRRTPGSVSLAFDPYGEGLDGWAPLAREAGHEFYIGLPLEPETFPAEDPGPLSMLMNLEPAEKRRRLEIILAKMVGYTGVLGLMGGRYLADEAQVTPMLTSLRLRGLLFVDGSMHAKSVVTGVASKIGLAHAVVGILLDGETTGRYVDAQLARAEILAREQGQVVVMGHSSPRTLERLLAWLSTIEDRRFLLAPVSALTKGYKDK